MENNNSISERFKKHGEALRKLIFNYKNCSAHSYQTNDINGMGWSCELWNVSITLMDFFEKHFDINIAPGDDMDRRDNYSYIDRMIIYVSDLYEHKYFHDDSIYTNNNIEIFINELQNCGFELEDNNLHSDNPKDKAELTTDEKFFDKVLYLYKRQ